MTEGERQERRTLIARQRAIWLAGAPRPSLWGAALGEIGLAEGPAAPRPYSLAERTPGAADRPLPPGARIVELYDRHRGALLVIGPPGSGKTTLLLELLGDLLGRAEADEALPIPVKFDLADWDQDTAAGFGPGRSADLHGWITERWLGRQLQLQDGMAEATARELVRRGAILPLLDGLDEVAPERRAACVTAIGTYCRGDDGRPLVLSCTEQVLGAFADLPLRHGVVVRPPGEAEVSGYLRAAGGRLAGLRRLLAEQPGLLAADGGGGPPLTTPLMLGALSLAYADVPALELPDASPARLRADALDRWATRALGGRAARDLRRLRWIAWQLRRTGRSTYRIDEMQPDWLISSAADMRLYVRLLALGDWLEDGLGRGLLFGLLFGLPLGLLLRWDAGLTGFVAGFVMGGAMGLAHNLDGGPGLWGGPWIAPAARRGWSWRAAWAGLRGHLALILGAGALSGLMGGVVGGAGAGVVVGLCVALCAALLAALPRGWVAAPGRSPLEPNAGIRASLRRGLALALTCGPAVGLGAAALAGPLVGAGAGLVAGLAAGLGGGLAPVAYHLILRLVLARRGVLPLDIAAFCARCAERGLLRPAGDGWQLAHSLLLEHLADQHAATMPAALRDGWPSPHHLLMEELLRRHAPPPAGPRRGGDGP